MKIIIFALIFLFFWAIVHGGDCDPEWYDDVDTTQRK